MMRFVRDLHKYFGLVLVVLILLVSVTGLLLMHAKSLGLNTIMVKMPGYASQAPPDAWKIVTMADGSILVATKSGIFRGSESTWSRRLDAPARDLLVHGGEVYGATKDGLMISTDNGLSWSVAIAREEFRTLAVSPEGVVAASARAIYRRSHAGARWQV
ncbi:MAG: hypothetical protein ABR524_09800, partial [Thermoanaerobaculia bacterium]